MNEFINDLSKEFEVKVINLGTKNVHVNVLKISDIAFCVEQNILDNLRKNDKYEKYLKEVKNIIKNESNENW